MKVLEVIVDVIVDQPITKPKTIFPEPVKAIVKDQPYEDSSSNYRSPILEDSLQKDPKQENAQSIEGDGLNKGNATSGKMLKPIRQDLTIVPTTCLTSIQLAKIKRTNPSGYLVIMMSLQSSSTEKNSSSSTISGGYLSDEYIDEILRQLKSKILD